MKKENIYFLGAEICCFLAFITTFWEGSSLLSYSEVWTLSDQLASAILNIVGLSALVGMFLFAYIFWQEIQKEKKP